MNWPDMIYKQLIILFIINAQIIVANPVYLFNIGYESPTLVAPAFISIIPYSQNLNLQVGIVGFTIITKSEYSVNKNFTFGISQDITPVNSNASTYRYRKGSRDETLNFENSTYLFQSYIRKKRREGRISQYSIIFLNEKVTKTAFDKYWDKPHIGFSILETWRSTDYEDFFNNRWNGLKFSGKLEIFPLNNFWYRGQIAGGTAYFKTPWHWIISGRLFLSKNLNIVNQHVIGGPWELDLLNFMQGSRYGEHRIHKGILLNIRTDYAFNEAIELGIRMSLVSKGNESHLGYGIKMITIHEGLVFNVGLSLSDETLKNRELNQIIISSSLTFGII